MPCFTPDPQITFEENLEIMLCKTCKLLTPAQIYEIHGSDDYFGLYQWYLEHLQDDISKNLNNLNRKNVHIEELRRLGYEVIIDPEDCSDKDELNFIEIKQIKTKATPQGEKE